MDMMLMVDSVPGFGSLGESRLRAIADKAESMILARYPGKVKEIKAFIGLDEGKVDLAMKVSVTSPQETLQIGNYADSALREAFANG